MSLIHSKNGQSLNYFKRRYFLLLAISLITVFLQFLCGWWADSVAVINDSFHTLTHSFGFLIAIFAEYSVERVNYLDMTEKQSRINSTLAYYGVALACIILVGIVLISHEAWERYQNPALIIGPIMILGAFIGIAGNGVFLFLIPPNKKTNVIPKLLTYDSWFDVAQSFLVLLTALIIYRFDIFILDSMISFVLIGFMALITLYALFTAFRQI